MTIKEYLIAKNAIIFKYTNVVLVPENQIIDMKPIPLIDQSGNDMGICPYCIEFYDLDKPNTCNGCPMFDANNGCLSKHNPRVSESTYSQVASLSGIGGIWNHPDDETKALWYEELKTLLIQYNEELK